MTFKTSRRHFLKIAGSLGGMGSAAHLGLNLAAIRAASAAILPDDYKALVCVFLYGGNDPYNTVIAQDLPSYTPYANARSEVAVAHSELNNTIITPDSGWGDNRSFALHPSLSSLKPVFDQGQLSMLMNVGTLLQPTSLADYEAKRNLPPKLMSHNDQFSLWQTSLVEGAHSGWGGRMGDLFAEANTANHLLTNITVGTSAGFSTGQSVQEFAMGSAGPVDLDSAYVANAYSEDVINTIRQMLKQQQTHLLDKELVRRNDIVIQGNAGLSQALENSPPLSMPDTPLGAQLNMIARIINANQLLGMKRNIFFVGMKGFDSHQSLNTSHPELLQALGDGLAAFQNEMNLAGLANNVTTFTASDFGRSLTSNGRGSDHGWGGHQFVMGGAVKERSWVGALPSLILGAEDDIGQGRLLPNISVDQYSATLARWMGVSDSDMQTVLPGIVNFDQTDLGFMT